MRVQNDGNLQRTKDVNSENSPNVLRCDGSQSQSNPKSVRNSRFRRQPARTGIITYCPATPDSSFFVPSVGGFPRQLEVCQWIAELEGTYGREARPHSLHVYHSLEEQIPHAWRL